MRIFRLILAAALLGLLLYAGNRPFGTVPPLGKVLNPFAGVWQNNENTTPELPDALTIEGLSAPVIVKYDDRMVPHLFATSDEDLYMAQGYITASMRLWQMDFMSRLPMGRLSEVMGSATLSVDRYFRRLGMPKACEQSLAAFSSDPKGKAALDAYTKGVNAYISSLTYSDLPVEYKLLDYEPEAWSPIKTAAIFKLMAFNLTGYETDIALTNFRQLFGETATNQLFPDFPEGLDPIVSGNIQIDSILQPDSVPILIPSLLTGIDMPVEPNPMNGSNNWAVHGSRTSTGAPLLANDPHLGLNLPAIWFEIQLHGPDVNVYGVSIPGVPMVVLGFNEHIAWGFTNAGRDVKDWYLLEMDDTGRRYRWDGEWRDLYAEVHEIAIKEGDVFRDTLYFTHFGPVTYDAHYPIDSTRHVLALRWRALEPSNEHKAIYHLNRATDYDSYVAAIRDFSNPAQNMVFASREGDIALWQQGEFPLLAPGQGKFVQDGSLSSQQWQGYIPKEQNPHYKNPERGFVSSANQHAADSTYPYYYQGIFEFFRNRRINHLLAGDSVVTVEDMMNFQNDNYNLFAEEAVPALLAALKEQERSVAGVQEMMDELMQWDYVNDVHSVPACYFEAWWNAIEALCHDEQEAYGVRVAMPADHLLLKGLVTYPENPYFDIDSTAAIETGGDIIRMAAVKAVSAIEDWKESTGKALSWAAYKNTTIAHWIGALTPFSQEVAVGGGRGILNANTSTHGASWRLVASLKADGIEAWGLYPGGQSGNPGSPWYNSFVDYWKQGRYYRLLLLQDKDATDDRIIHQTTIR